MGEAEIRDGAATLTTVAEAVAALSRTWLLIVEECRAVLGSELHYQAVIITASAPPAYREPRSE